LPLKLPQWLRQIASFWQVNQQDFHLDAKHSNSLSNVVEIARDVLACSLPPAR
jgi:hypothetical protein